MLAVHPTSSTFTTTVTTKTVTKPKPPVTGTLTLAASTSASASALPALHTYHVPKDQSPPTKRKRVVPSSTSNGGGVIKKRKQTASSSSSSSTAASRSTTRTSTPSTSRDDDSTSDDGEFDYSNLWGRPKPVPVSNGIPFGFGEHILIPRRRNASCGIQLGGDQSAISSEQVVKTLISKYKTHFNGVTEDGMSFEHHPTNYPFVDLVYPNPGPKASERFILLTPIDEDHYNPIQELMNTITTIIAHYIPPDDLPRFGSLEFTPLYPVPSHPKPPPPVTTEPDHLRQMRKAYVSRDGPAFVSSVQYISNLLVNYGPSMMQTAWSKWTGVPPMVCQNIVEECYQRTVGPSVKDLAKYAPFSNTVYGELNAPFVSDIIHRTGLNGDKVFVDLGCGVGNCLLQASLQSGCTSCGIEINPPPAALGRLQLEEFHRRVRKWGLNSGPIHFREGDFCESEDVRAWIKVADVILVNNWAFSSTLNASLSLLFLDLKEGAKIISLKPFRRSDFRLTDRTTGSPEAIFRDVEEVEFRKGTVSWTNEGGTYYLHTVDREPLRKFMEHQVANPPTSRKRRIGAASHSCSPAP